MPGREEPADVAYDRRPGVSLSYSCRVSTREKLRRSILVVVVLLVVGMMVYPPWERTARSLKAEVFQPLPSCYAALLAPQPGPITATTKRSGHLVFDPSWNLDPNWLVDRDGTVARGWTIEARVDAMRLLLQRLPVLLLAGVAWVLLRPN